MEQIPFIVFIGMIILLLIIAALKTKIYDLIKENTQLKKDNKTLQIEIMNRILKEVKSNLKEKEKQRGIKITNIENKKNISYETTKNTF